MFTSFNLPFNLKCFELRHLNSEYKQLIKSYPYFNRYIFATVNIWYIKGAIQIIRDTFLDHLPSLVSFGDICVVTPSPPMCDVIFDLKKKKKKKQQQLSFKLVPKCSQIF